MNGIAEEFFHEFKTCRQNGEGLKGKAHVNLKVMTQITEGQGHFQKVQCYKVRVANDKITAQIMVALIQGTLLHAHNVQIGTRPNREAADGTAYGVHAGDIAGGARVQCGGCQDSS